MISNPTYQKIRNLWELFLIYCILGWTYEVIWCNIIENNKGFINNGFLFGPWLPIYGIGMFIIMGTFIKFDIETPGKIFLYGAIIATIAELIGSYFMQLIMGKWLWDYSAYFLNFQGRIALKPEIYFGILILIGVYFIRPKIIEYQEKYNPNLIRNIISIIIFSLFIIDVLLRFKYGSNLTHTTVIK